MNQNLREPGDGETSLEIEVQRRLDFNELKERTFWFIRLRWFVPPVIMAASVAASLIGFSVPVYTLFLVAGFIGAYNIVLHFWGRQFKKNLDRQRRFIRRLTRWQFGLDYITMLLLIHLTGGITSPLIFFCIFHIIFAAMLLPPRSCYAFATLVAGGMMGITLAEHANWIPHHPLIFQDAFLNFQELPVHTASALGFFIIAIYGTAFFTSSIMQMLRLRISNLFEVLQDMRRLNQKLGALYTLTQAILSTKKLDAVLTIATNELCEVMGVLGISVKLLSDDGKYLHYTAAGGIVADIFKSKVVDVARSPLNRQIIEGHPFITGRVTPGEMFQFGEDLAAANVKSVLFVPLLVQDRVIGILGAYCKYEDRFSSWREVEFFRQAAGLVAVAIENSKSYEAIEKLMKDRAWFMMRVAHNLRSPLAAVISILDVVRGGYQGELSEAQAEYLRRVDRRVRTMIALINELLVLAEKREGDQALVFKPVDLGAVAGRIQRTFQDEALHKDLLFTIEVQDNLPKIQGDAEMIEQVLENLVSNAIKYSETGGKVTLEILRGLRETVDVRVGDNGIGIPEEAKPRLFTEFFRADNARALEEQGTGLGLAIVKEIVEQHGGKIIVESNEGIGSLFVVQLPISGKPGNPGGRVNG